MDERISVVPRLGLLASTVGLKKVPRRSDLKIGVVVIPCGTLNPKGNPKTSKL